jgi:hypothetical protein
MEKEVARLDHGKTPRLFYHPGGPHAKERRDDVELFPRDLPADTPGGLDIGSLRAY